MATQRKTEEFPGGIPMDLWSKDHWSTFAYIETRFVDYHGQPDKDHMRTDQDLHPGLTGPRCSVDLIGSKKYPTRIKGGEVEGHDDWSCLEDAEKAGLLHWCGTGFNPVFILTEYGKRMAAKLREHKAHGGTFSNFTAWVSVQKPDDNGPSQKQYQEDLVRGIVRGSK